MHIMESLIDPSKLLAMGDELIHLQLPVHIIGHKIRELRAAFDAAESATLPSAAGDELERCIARKSATIQKPNEGNVDIRRVLISCPAAATPMIILSPHPL